LSPEQGALWRSEWIVAYPDRTAFFGEYFRMGGDPTGNVGDEDFSACHAPMRASAMMR
jgi:hypothetical protein